MIPTPLRFAAVCCDLCREPAREHSLCQRHAAYVPLMVREELTRLLDRGSRGRSLPERRVHAPGRLHRACGADPGVDGSRCREA